MTFPEIDFENSQIISQNFHPRVREDFEQTFERCGVDGVLTFETMFESSHTI